MNSPKILDVWNKLSKTDSPGLVKSLYSPDFSQYIYCTKVNPQGHIGIGISYKEAIKVNIKSLSKLRDVQIYTIKDSSFEGHNILILQLLNSKFTEIFSALCENLIQSIANLPDTDSSILTIVNHLEKWKTLFSNLGLEGLSTPEQQGLYGEIHFLRKLLNSHRNNLEVLNMWVGVDKELRDFQNLESAVEVKTTSSSNHQRLTISSERQLDDSLLTNLYLYHLSIETSADNGETLNQAIASVRQHLNDDFIALNTFNGKLMTAGYFDEHNELYNARAYKFRRENTYKISGEFPRIRESELMGGVGDVQYTIITDLCSEYLISDNETFKGLGLCKK